MSIFDTDDIDGTLMTARHIYRRAVTDCGVEIQMQDDSSCVLGRWDSGGSATYSLGSVPFGGGARN